MTDRNKPYPSRQALPISFFPFLSAEYDTAEDGVREFLNSLDRDNTRPAETLVYIHVPFCETICAFCGFYRKPIQGFCQDETRPMLERFVENLLLELSMWGRIRAISSSNISAVYIGGGSPSLLPADLVRRLLAGICDALPFSPGSELSFEGEVRSLNDPELIESLIEHHVTRISFGVQALHPTVRKLSGLVAPLELVFTCAETLRRFGCRVNIDMMYGLPGQTLDIFQNDLETAVVHLGAGHIDLYETIHYPNSALFTNWREYQGLMPSEETCRSMIRHAVSYLRSKGYRQITSDDFVLPGSEYAMKQLTFGGGNNSSHILAIGPTSVGYLSGTSYRNHVLESYIDGPLEHPPIQRIRRASIDDLARRPFVFFPKLLKVSRHGLPFPVPEDVILAISRQIDNGLVAPNGPDGWAITDSGQEWIDAISCDFLPPDSRRKIFKLIQ